MTDIEQLVRDTLKDYAAGAPEFSTMRPERRRRRWTLTAPIAGVAVAAILVGVFVWFDTRPRHPSDLPAGGLNRYLSLLAIVKGTATQINAGQYVEESTYQNGFAGCMAEAGFEYPQRPFMPPEPDADVSVRLGTEWLEPPAGDLDIAEFKVAQRFASRDWRGSPYYDLAPDQQEAYDKALDGCLKHEASWTVDSLPHSVSVVRNALFMLVEQVEEGLDTSGYGPCMEAQGFDVSSYSELYRYVATQLPPSSQAPQSIDRGTAEWRAGVALERQAAQADAECRGDIYAEGVAALGDELPAFEERFADDIATIPTEWSALVAEADQLAPNGHCARCRVE